MPRGQYIRCQIREWDWLMGCNKKGDWISYIDHQDYQTGNEYRDYYLVCRSHWEWLDRPATMYNIDYACWVNNL
jgi:hypothetical protein